MDHTADAHRTDLMTITRHVLNEQSRNPESRGDFTILLSHIVLGCKFVASAVNKAGLAKLIGLAGETNVQASAPPGFLIYIYTSIDRALWMDRSQFSPARSSCLINLVRATACDRERSRRSWTCCPTRCSSRPSSAAAAPYGSRILLVHFPSSVPVLS